MDRFATAVMKKLITDFAPPIGRDSGTAGAVTGATPEPVCCDSGLWPHPARSSVVPTTAHRHLMRSVPRIDLPPCFEACNIITSV
jgi:hypothetical protein